jgi:hypothetical protein
VTKAENGQGYTITALDNATMERLKQGKERSQVIMSMDMRDWEHFCTRVRPEDCLMSHRPPAYIPGQPRTPHAGLAFRRLLVLRPCLDTAPRGASAGACIRNSCLMSHRPRADIPGQPRTPHRSLVPCSFLMSWQFQGTTTGLRPYITGSFDRVSAISCLMLVLGQHWDSQYTGVLDDSSEHLDKTAGGTQSYSTVMVS